MPSELPSAVVEPVPVAQLAPPGQALAAFPAPVPNYQDLSESDSDGHDDDADHDWEAIVAAGNPQLATKSPTRRGVHCN